jgi:phosphatidylserine/phosphatidylglycerophosphate/cardiolipin synthase-like enzyme
MARTNWRWLACAPLLVALGCSGGDNAGDEDSAAVVEGGVTVSYVGKSVMSALTNAPALNALRGRTWELTGGNALADSWLLPTFGQAWWGDKLASLPMDTQCKDDDASCDASFHMRTCDADADCSSGSCAPVAASVASVGAAPTKMCVGYADWYEDAVYSAIIAAEKSVDITALWQPSGRFVAAIHNALAILAAKGKRVTVRILTGNTTDVGPLASMHTSELLSAITQGLPPDAPLKIYVAKHSASFLSWNHAKMVTVDGRAALVGGHNMTTDDYQLKDPVSDLSMRLTGPAAAAAHRFANELWDVACKRGALHGLGLSTFPDGQNCPGPIEPSRDTGNGGTTVIAAGRLGAVADNASDAALLAMVDAAKTRIVMSQQDILGGRLKPTSLAAEPPPKPLLERLAAAIGRGVDVYLIISNVDGGFFTTSYSHGWTAAETAKGMADVMKAKTDAFPRGSDIVTTLCEKLHVSSLRLSDLDKWPDGKVFANHAKFLMIDTQAFYVGSQNLYSSDLAEFGFIVDSAKAAQVANDTYWSPIWSNAKRIAASGYEASACALR